ncbi:MAG: CPBP family intramembrane metalloprotease [Gemmataceae bacterium]|nr:CPBP family intramembrane metalloprotease [Gemmataceae bacterium]
MNLIPETGELPPSVVPFRRRSWPILAWIVVLALVGFIVWHRARPVPQGESANRYAGMVVQMQSRYLVGAAEFLRALGQPPADLAVQTAALNTGPIDQRLRVAAVTGELAGPQAALDQLDDLERRLANQSLNPNAEQARTLALLRRLDRDYAAKAWTAPSLNDAERAELRTQLGWFGELALAPRDGADRAAREQVTEPALRTFGALLGFVLGMVAVGAGGLLGLFLFFSALMAGRVRLRLSTGSPGAGIYAETFALWMLLFMALSFAASQIPAGGARFLILGVAMLLSLVTLAWPIARGIPWHQVRQDLGLFAGPAPVGEIALGFASYAMALPMLFIGLMLTLLLLRLQGAMPNLDAGNAPDHFELGDMPSHPIVEALVHLGWWGRLQVLFLGSLVAPIVEETMFRGVLYRHLREASVGLRRFSSVVFSATVVSFVFAVIHPQGMATVPALMALAYAFTLAREWRGTLIPAMVAHGLNNAIMLTLTILILSP